MTLFKCKMCGGDLELREGFSVAVCEYCGSKQTLPRLDDERRANLYDRANHFRRNNEFDKAAGIYEQILNEGKTDAEAYWSLVLCRYGIEYVEDPATRKRIPTINRAQFTSVFDDDNYKSALAYADESQKAVYEAEAKAINEIQKGILAISQKEEPFDVFICYKETDNHGRRTPDSVLANELYHQLTQEGFKVFFSRITLEDKLGSAYEPYIFAALNSAKVMVVLGTRPEYFNAIWVRNEWSRYLALIRSGAKKMLIPAYRDMDPYNLPEEFSHLQAQDMSKLGFMQDLIRGIKKITQTNEPKTVIRETVSVAGNTSIAPLLKRVFLFLEDGDWASANEYCERVLDLDPESAEAYLGKLMAELHVRTQERLKDQTEPFDGRNNYQKAVRFANGELKRALYGYIDYIHQRNENAHLTEVYRRACHMMDSAESEVAYKEAAELFESVSHFEDAAVLVKKCRELAEAKRKDAILSAGKARMNEKLVSSYEKAIQLFDTIPGWKDAEELSAVCQREIVVIQSRTKRNRKIAINATAMICGVLALLILFNSVISPLLQSRRNEATTSTESPVEAAPVSTEESKEQQITPEKEPVAVESRHGTRNTVSSSWTHTVAVKEDGTVMATGDNSYGQCDVSDWTDIVAIGAGKGHTVGLKTDGTVVATGYNKSGQCDVGDWTDIVAIAASREGGGLGYHTVGLKANGTAVATGDNSRGQCSVSDWTDIVDISAGALHTVGLKADGTVVAVGFIESMQRDISRWTDIVAISAGPGSTIGLRADGTLVATGSIANYGVSDWKNIIAVTWMGECATGLKTDGTVVSAGQNASKEYDVGDWKDIVAVNDFVGFRADGTLVPTTPREIPDWTDIKLPEPYRRNQTVTDTVSSTDVSLPEKPLSDSSSKTISVGYHHTAGLRSDGTVVATGFNSSRQCEVDSWTDIVSISTGPNYTVGLRSDGTAVAAYNIHWCDVSSWTDIIAISATRDYIAGLRSNGTVVAVGNGYRYKQSDTSGWTEIVAISAGVNHTVGLRSDGTVVATGNNPYGGCNVGDWTDIVAIDTGEYHTAGLKANGTVVAVGVNSSGQCNVESWTDIVAISTGDRNTVGLRSDGTVVAVGANNNGQCNVGDWTDIIAIDTSKDCTVGLRSDGTVVATGANSYGQCNVNDWTNIIAVCAGFDFTVGLRNDGTVVATGNNDKGQCNVSDWTNIRIPNT